MEKINNKIKMNIINEILNQDKLTNEDFMKLTEWLSVYKYDGPFPFTVENNNRILDKYINNFNDFTDINKISDEKIKYVFKKNINTISTYIDIKNYINIKNLIQLLIFCDYILVHI